MDKTNSKVVSVNSKLFPPKDLQQQNLEISKIPPFKQGTAQKQSVLYPILPSPHTPTPKIKNNKNQKSEPGRPEKKSTREWQQSFYFYSPINH